MGKSKGKKRNNKVTTEIKRIGPKSRKDIRKEKRALKKNNKREYFSKSITTGELKEIGKFVKAPVEVDDDIADLKHGQKNQKSKNAKEKQTFNNANIIMQESKGAKKREEKLKIQMKQQRNSQLLKANDDEDKIIKKLEKQLKLKKRKSGNICKSFAADGLGYLLEVCDERTMQAAVAAERHLAETGSGSDFEEDMAIATGKSAAAYQKSDSKKAKRQIDGSGSDSSNFGLSDDDDDLNSENADFNSENEQSDDEDEVMDFSEVKSAQKKTPPKNHKLRKVDVCIKNKKLIAKSQSKIDGVTSKKSSKKAFPDNSEEIEDLTDDDVDLSDNESLSNNKSNSEFESSGDEDEIVKINSLKKTHSQKKSTLKGKNTRKGNHPTKDNKIVMKSQTKKPRKPIKKQLYSDDSEDNDITDDDSDINSDDEVEEEEDEELEDMEDNLEEQLSLIYSSLGSFPDESFQPGNLTPVKEETEHDLDLYRKNIEVSTNSPPKGLTSTSVHHAVQSDEDEMEIDDDDDDEEDEEMDEEEVDFDNLSDPDCENSECSDSDCCDDHSEGASKNKQIIVNGKIINTYGRDFEKEVEPDIVKCARLDKLLENLSSTESECEKSFDKADIEKKEKSKSKENLKRKLDVDTNIKNIQKKQKKMQNEFKPAEKISQSDSSNKKTEVEKIKNNKSKIAKSDSEEGSDDDIGSDDDLSVNMASENGSESSVVEDEEKKDTIWEDIYGRQRDKDGNVVTNQTAKYVPPHLRAKKNLEDSKEIQQLKRQIKGLLNKVAGSNMHWTATQLESLYSSNSRNAVNSAFCSLWLNALVQPTVISDRLAAEHTMLVAILHANVGSEVGAHFLQTVVKKFDEMLETDQKLENKELDNLILAISNLYSFKIFQSPLLYEILNKLLEQLSEKSIDCTLVALRSVGAVLRKDDPASLKTFINTTQERASKLNDGSSKGSRVKFLLDVLMAIKNNNMNKIPNYDPSYTEELKKAMRGIIRKGNYIVPLNIKLEDLLRADERGKWWVVGSAWEGSAKEEKEKEESGGSKQPMDRKHAQLMELALQQRINTDLRRNIFCIIMAAEDYMDAFEKLQQLGLKNQQEREIIHIIIACCLQEKIYNPYYAVLAQKFCDFDRKYQMSIQYSIWDKLKEIDTWPLFQIANLGQFLTYLFIEKGLPISILKVVQFSDLTKATLRLMRQILLAILLHKRWQTCLEVFQRVAVSPKLHLFREGLRLFISHFLIKNSDKKERLLSQDQMALLKERASAVDKTLHADSKLQF